MIIIIIRMTFLRFERTWWDCSYTEPDAGKCWEQLVRYTGIQRSQQQVCTYFPLWAENKQKYTYKNTKTPLFVIIFWQPGFINIMWKNWTIFMSLFFFFFYTALMDEVTVNLNYDLLCCQIGVIYKYRSLFDRLISQDPNARLRRQGVKIKRFFNFFFFARQTGTRSHENTWPQDRVYMR